MNVYRRLTSALLPLAIPLLAIAGQPGNSAPAFAAHDGEHAAQAKPFSPLVDKVRKATAKYRDINVMFSEGGWAAATPCVSGPNSGAMGVHFVKDGRVGDGILRADQPEALIYEPLRNGAMRLVGVEFIELKDVWDSLRRRATETRGTSAQPGDRAESLHAAGVLRAPCLGVGRQPGWQLRRLEHRSFLRQATARLN